MVDDDPAMVGAITALVGTEGHQVITAYDGLTAVRRYREERPDIVLLDLAMPGPDGFTVAGQIRAEGDAPIVVVSGESSEEAKVRALGIGADDYLVKPFGRAELLARIAAVMRRADRTPAGAAGGRGRRRRHDALRPARWCWTSAATRRASATPARPDPDRVPPRRGARPRGGDLVPHLRLVRAGWPAEADPDLLWLKPHVARLRRKVEAAGGPEILAVRGVGYRLEPGRAGWLAAGLPERRHPARDLYAAVDAELVEDVRDMALDGALADEQLRRDGGIQFPHRHQPRGTSSSRVDRTDDRPSAFRGSAARAGDRPRECERHHVPEAHRQPHLVRPVVSGGAGSFAEAGAGRVVLALVRGRVPPADGCPDGVRAAEKAGGTLILALRTGNPRHDLRDRREPVHVAEVGAKLDAFPSQRVGLDDVA